MPIARTGLAVLVLAVAGCGGSSEPAEPERPDTPFTRAADATRAAGVADVELDRTTEGGDGPETSSSGTADLKAGTEARTGLITAGKDMTNVEFFADGDAAYAKEDGGTWEAEEAGVLPVSVVEAIAFAEATDGEPGDAGTAATSSGVASIYETTVSMGALADVVEGGEERFAGDGTLPIAIYVGRDDGRLLRVTVQQPDAEGGEAAVDVGLRSFGQAEAPETPQDLPAG